jgi:hypothetical protein
MWHKNFSPTARVTLPPGKNRDCVRRRRTEIQKNRDHVRACAVQGVPSAVVLAGEAQRFRREPRRDSATYSHCQHNSTSAWLTFWLWWIVTNHKITDDNHVRHVNIGAKGFFNFLKKSIWNLYNFKPEPSSGTSACHVASKSRAVGSRSDGSNHVKNRFREHCLCTVLHCSQIFPTRTREMYQNVTIHALSLLLMHLCYAHTRNIPRRSN